MVAAEGTRLHGLLEEGPVDAIKPDTEDDPDGKWLKVNTDYALIWPNITVKGTPPPDAAPSVLSSLPSRRSGREKRVPAAQATAAVFFDQHPRQR